MADQSQHPQPSPDLEPVRRLIRAAELMHERQTYEEAVEWDREIAKYAEDALPMLKSLLTSHGQLIGLLCRAHRDGGHYINDHGIDKAVEDADMWIAEAYAERDSLLAEIEYVNSDSVQLQIKELNEGWAASLVEIEKLREDLSTMTQAVGLASTSVPSMEIDVTDPIGMMHKVVAEITRLREENARMKAAITKAAEEGLR